MFIYIGNERYLNPAHVVSTYTQEKRTYYELANGENVKGDLSIEDTVVGIAPAVDWYAVYTEKGKKFETGHSVISVVVPLACWALMLDGQVKGMESTGMEFLETAITDGFHSYQKYAPDSVPSEGDPII